MEIQFSRKRKLALWAALLCVLATLVLIIAAPVKTTATPVSNKSTASMTVNPNVICPQAVSRGRVSRNLLTCCQYTGDCPTPHPPTTPAPTPVPTPVPTARPATSTELTAFAQFAPTNSGWSVDEDAVAGSYALVGFYNTESGVTAILQQNSSGQWVLLKRGGGQFIPDTMVRYAGGMSTALAQNLYNLAVSQDI